MKAKREGRSAGVTALICKYGEPLVLPALLLVGLQLLVTYEILPPNVFASTAQVVTAGVKLVTQEDFWISVESTVTAWGFGMVIAIGLAIPIGMIVGSFPAVDRLLRFSVNIVKPIPMVATMPLLMLMFGIGTRMNVVLVALSAVWPLFYQSILGVKTVDGTARDMLHCQHASRVKVFFRLILPSSLPSILTGLRLAAIIGFILAIAGSLIGGGAGLGSDIAIASQNGTVSVMWADVLVCGIIGLIITGGLAVFERRALWWHVAYRSRSN